MTRKIGWIAPGLALLSALAFPRTAAADTMDPALARLVTDSSCRSTGVNGGLYYNPKSSFTRCGTDDAAFAKLIAQYGAAIAPTGMHTARTTGFGGFELALEGSFTSIDKDADFWKQGTQGAQDKSTGRFSIANPSPDPVLQSYTLKIRKGFPFGIELAGQFGFLGNTSIYTIGADVRFAPFEGFRTGVPSWFPEVAATGSVRTITGTDQFQLTVAAVDGVLSKPIPMGGSVSLTPYAGYQWMRIFGDSGLIDLTPNTDAVNFCGYVGSNNLATPDANKTVRDGQPVCAHGTSADFNNTAVFNPVRLSRHRAFGGLQLRFQMVRLGAHFSMDVMAPEEANKGADYEIKKPNPDGGADLSENVFKGLSKQWTVATDIGAIF
ncbi:MAG: hypothetical protein U0359_04050 [Byssovorax sp.]